MKRILFLFAALVFTSAEARSGDSVRVGVSLSLTGKYSEMGSMQQKGFRLWEADVNSRGGLLGKKVALIVKDDRSDPGVAREAYAALVGRERVDQLFAPYSTELTAAIQETAEENGYPLLISGAAGDSLWQRGYKHSFGVYTSANRYTAGFLEMIVMGGLNDLAVVSADDAFSRDLFEGTKTWAKRFGLDLLYVDMFRKGTRDLEPQARKARDSGAAILIVCGHLDESVNMRLALKRIGWQPKVYYASVGPGMDAYRDRLKDDADLAYSSSQWESHGGLNNPGSREFTAAFARRFGETPSYHAATAYAAGQILESAIRKAKSLQREKVRTMLATMDATTIIGRYGVDGTGMQIRHFPLIIQWQKGRREVVWPRELRTAGPVLPPAGRKAR